MNAPALKRVARSTVVDTVTQQIRTEILTGGYAVGARLPAERDLAEQLGVNRLTLRAALSRLEAAGLIATQHGTGSVVRDFRCHGGIETLPNYMRVTRDGDPEAYLALVRDMFDLRRALAAEAVALAAARHTDADLEAIREAARAQAPRVGNVLAFARGDVDFARLVVRASRNIGLELLLNTIARVPEDDPGLLRAMYPRPRAQHAHYDVVVALIASREPERARELMRAALEAFDRLTLARIERRVRASSTPRPQSTRGRTAR